MGKYHSNLQQEWSCFRLEKHSLYRKHLYHLNCDIQLLKKQRIKIKREFKHKHSQIREHRPIPKPKVLLPKSNLFFTNATWEQIMTQSRPTIITAIIGNEDLTTNIVSALAAFKWIHTCCLLIDKRSNINTITTFLNPYDKWLRKDTIDVTYGNFYDDSSEVRKILVLSKLSASKKKVFNHDIWKQAKADCLAEYNSLIDANGYTHAMDELGCQNLINAMPEITSQDRWLEIGLGYPRFAYSVAKHYPMISVIGNDIGHIVEVLLSKPFPETELPLPIHAQREAVASVIDVLIDKETELPLPIHAQREAVASVIDVLIDKVVESHTCLTYDIN